MTLGRDLSRRSDDELRRLFEHRPDLLVRPPSTFGEMANRVANPQLVAQAVDALDIWSHDVLSGVAHLGGRASADDVVDLLAVGHPPSDDLRDHVRRGFGELRDRGLVVVSDDDVASTVGPISYALPRPFGLARPAAELLAARNRDELVLMVRHLDDAFEMEAKRANKAALVAHLAAAFSDPGAVASLLADAPPGTEELFDRAVWAGAVRLPFGYGQTYRFGYGRRDTRPDIDWLLERGLLVMASYEGAEVPREAAIARRGRVVHLLLPTPPPAATGARAIGEEPAVAAAKSAARAILSTLDAVCAELGRQPAALLKSGGVGTRDLKRLAKVVGADEPRVGLLLELTTAAQLTAIDVAGGQVLPTPEFDEWRRRPPAERWVHVIAGWRASTRFHSVAGRRSDDGKLVPALSPEMTHPTARWQRDRVLQALESLPPHSAPDHEALGTHVVWFSPQRWHGPAPADHLVEWILDEAELLGWTGGGALVELHPEDLLGRPATEITLQADLTAVSPAGIDGNLAALLEDAADVESKGAATVWRFSDGSVRRALDRGRTADELLSTLSAAATKGVPQPLEYLIGDVARRHGLLRVGAVGCYLRADDPSLVTAATRVKGAAKLGLRAIAPTVAVASSSVDKVLDLLRAAGMAPVEEDGGGGVVLQAPAEQRLQPPAPEAGGRQAEILRRLAERRGAAPPPAEPDDVIRTLRAAPPPKDEQRPLPTPVAASRDQPTNATMPLFQHDLLLPTEPDFDEVDDLLEAAVATGATAVVTWFDNRNREREEVVRVIDAVGERVILLPVAGGTPIIVDQDDVVDVVIIDSKGVG